ncbi:MAG: hypothetical protein R3F61_26125 [Myxococcota bacterium]
MPAHPVSIGVSAGYQASTRSGLVDAPQVGALVDWRIGTVLHLEAAGVFAPSLRVDRHYVDLYPPSNTLGTQDVVRRQALVSLMPVFSPLRGRLTRPVDSEIGLDVGLGFGVVHTLDDLEALQAEDDAVAVATEVQWHPALVWTAGPRVGLGDRWTARMRLRGTTWIETIEGVSLQSMHPVDLGLTVARAL